MKPSSSHASTTPSTVMINKSFQREIFLLVCCSTFILSHSSANSYSTAVCRRSLFTIRTLFPCFWPVERVFGTVRSIILSVAKGAGPGQPKAAQAEEKPQKSVRKPQKGGQKPGQGTKLAIFDQVRPTSVLTMPFHGHFRATPILTMASHGHSRPTPVLTTPSHDHFCPTPVFTMAFHDHSRATPVLAMPSHDHFRATPILTMPGNGGFCPRTASASG